MHRSHIKLWRSSRHLAVFLESNKQGGCINKKDGPKKLKRLSPMYMKFSIILKF